MKCRGCSGPIPHRARGSGNQRRYFCSTVCYNEWWNAERRQGTREKVCPDCGKTFTFKSLTKIRCDRCHRRNKKKDPASRRRGYALRDPARRAAIEAGDLSLEDEREILFSADCCPLCAAELTDEAGPHQRNLDHIIPIKEGGPHTRANVRLLCQSCNRRRPRDGRDARAMVFA